MDAKTRLGKRIAEVEARHRPLFDAETRHLLEEAASGPEILYKRWDPLTGTYSLGE